VDMSKCSYDAVVQQRLLRLGAAAAQMR